MLRLVLTVAVIAMSVQLPRTTSVARVGRLERQLTEQDVANIEGELRASPWLLIGAHGQTWAKTVTAFLPPRASTPALRRGAAVVLTREYSGPTAAWSIVDKLDYGRFPYSDQYAQVAIDGRDPDLVQSDADNNRPFFIDGRFTDEELIGIARYIRSIRSGPITSVVRNMDDTFDVWIADRPGEFRIVQIREGHTWSIVRVGTLGV